MKLIKDSLIYLGGELFAKSLPFLLLPYLTRTLGAAGYGTLSYWQTVAAFLLVLIGFTQEAAVARYYYFYGRRGLGRILTAGSLYTAAAAAVLLLAAWLAQSPILAAVTLAAASQSLLAVQLALRQCQKRALSYTAIQTASGIAAALFTVLLLEYTRGDPVPKQFFAFFAAQFTVAAAAWWFGRGSLNAHFGRRSLARSLRYLGLMGAPLILHQSGNLIKGQLDRFVGYRYFPAEHIGVYGAAFQIALVFSVLLLAVNKAAVPHYYQALKSRRIQAADVRRWACLSLCLTPLPPLLAWLLPESVYLWFLGAPYVGAKYYTCLFLCGFSLSMPYLVLVNYLFYHGQNHRIAAISICSAAVYAAVLFAAIPFGLNYLPLAVIIGNAAALPLLYRAVGRVEREKTV